MTDHISTDLNKFTRLTGLQLLTDWTSHKNCSSTTLFSFAPPPSLLLLPPSVNFLTLLISCYNSSCLHLNSELNLFSCRYVVTPASEGKIEQPSKQ